MSEFNQESLSALLDDEADELALPRLLKLYEENPEIIEKWRRFSLVQSIIRDEIVPIKQGFMEGVREGIDKEEKISRLGDERKDRQKASNQISPEHWHEGDLIAVHGCTFDVHGALYAQEWNVHGRVTKYVRVETP